MDILKIKQIRLIKMKWKLFAKDYSLLDLEVEKISLIQSQKSETLSLLKKHKGDFSKLFEEISKSKSKMIFSMKFPNLYLISDFILSFFMWILVLRFFLNIFFSEETELKFIKNIF